jgi:serine/threonine-protein kinase
MAGRGEPLLREDERSELAHALPAYELGAPLGRGAFAVVMAARHVRLDREVAIKRLSPELLRDSSARDRFATEARLLASLDHPHVVRVHDYVEEERVCALVMERLHGGTLADRVGPLSPARACALIVAALHGLEHAHRHGVLHRDVKPENLLFGERDVMKVADFGIARVVGAQGARLTATAAVLGTPAFMAPEQVSSSVGPLSPATDAWAAAAVLYELLAGESAFPLDGDLGDVLYRRMTDDARPLRERAPHVPAALDDVVMRGLARDPSDRYESAGAFAEALERAVGRAEMAATGVPVHRTEAAPPAPGGLGLVETADAAPPGPGLAQTADAAAPGGTLAETADAPLPSAPAAPPPPGRRRRQLWAALAGVATVAAAGVGAILAGSRDGEEPAPPAPAASRAELPGPPPGWPRTMALGHYDPVDGAAGAAKRLGRGGLTPEVFGGDAAAREDWSNNPDQLSPARFVAQAHREGLMPYAIYYQLRTIGQAGQDAEGPQLRRTLADPELMEAYWRNVRLFLKSLGSARRPVAVSLESGVWPLLEQNLGFVGARPDTIDALVGASGLPELRGLPDTLPGVAQGWVRLRNRYAPQALLGYRMADYGTNVDISRRLPAEATLVAAGRDAGHFYLELAVLDFAGLEIAYSEEGQNPNRIDVYSPEEKEGVVTFVREFVRTTGMPMIIDDVPLGNTVMKTIDDGPYHWRDSWVEWLIGTDRFSGLRRLRDAGVIGVHFGVSSGETETCACDAAQDGVTNGGRRGRVATSPDDDGGYLAERMTALRRSGGMSLAP